MGDKEDLNSILKKIEKFSVNDWTKGKDDECFYLELNGATIRLEPSGVHKPGLFGPKDFEYGATFSIGTQGVGKKLEIYDRRVNKLYEQLLKSYWQKSEEEGRQKASKEKQEIDKKFNEWLNT